MSEDRYLTFALGKGRLANKTMELLEKIGITCEEMKDKDSRKLIFVNEELKLKFFLSKSPDVPTYVEYGAADIGVVGKDTLLEEDRRVYEVLDLGYGKCRMCVCGPKSAKELLQHHEMIRVASKYPNIAKDYFYNKKHQTVDIIKLNGSVELGPIGKLEKVNWYLELIESGSKKYIVPQSKAQLEQIRDQLLAAHKTIMATKIPDPKTRPIIDIKYPDGFEG